MSTKPKYWGVSFDVLKQKFGSTIDKINDHLDTLPKEVQEGVTGIGIDGEGIVLTILETTPRSIKERIVKEFETFDEVHFIYRGQIILH